MNYTNQNTQLGLLARNEGKIRCYESCSDVRAWSHDLRVRDRYLREWIKYDMPICVLSVSTLAGFLRTMTYRNRGKAIPRCHPDCKSKVLLESICNSCHAMKSCLKNDENYEKYFQEEEFETSHWPCERCLEALKSIKMFWKIIVEKLFNMSVSNNEEFENADCNRDGSVRSVAKVWQNEMVQQALFVKNITPLLRRAPTLIRNNPSNQNRCVTKETTSQCPKLLKIEDEEVSYKNSKYKSCSCSTKSQTSKTSDTRFVSNGDSKRTHARRICKKVSRCTSFRVKMIDFGCNTCNIENENEELKVFKTNLEYLQQQYNIQNNETERLKKENTSLRIELQNVYKSCPWRASFYSPRDCNDKHTVTLVPKPFESCEEEDINKSQVKDIDSEMIITMKNCKNESFKHVSLLQVLHKTNEPIVNDLNKNQSCCKKEDPMDLLTKVQNTFGEIVRREMTMVSERKNHTWKTNIDATFHRVNVSKSAPSCSTIASNTQSSESNFVSTKDISERAESQY